MFDIEAITQQVLHNCNVSDAQHAGIYSICELALRLRDLYKWENGLSPWVEDEASGILIWIEQKEILWETLTETPLERLVIGDNPFDPFDTININEILIGEGFFYGAGYARSLKPTFFLAEIVDVQSMAGYPVYILGKELARDLLTLPAMTQDEAVVLRERTAMFYLWDQIFYIGKSGRPALEYALDHWGIPKNDTKALRKALPRIYTEQKNIFLYHELAEIKEDVFDRTIWREIIGLFPHTSVELLSRTVKDLLADTGPDGSLSFIVNREKSEALALYVAFFGGFAVTLFPELRPAFTEFMKNRNWNYIQETVNKGYSTAKQCAETIMDIYRIGKKKNDIEWIRNEIEEKLVQPRICQTV